MIDRTHGAMADCDTIGNPKRRRSARLSSPPRDHANRNATDKMALAAGVKRSITVRKIAPRKTAAPSEHNKENKPRRSERGCSQPKVSTPGDDTRRGRSSPAKKGAVAPSPILPSTTPPPPCQPRQPGAHPEDAAWSQKVRRSYSRLGDKSHSSPESRETLFGFERLRTPEVLRSAGHSFSCLSGLNNSFASLLEAEARGSAFPEPDANIPGVAVTKERKRRRRRMQRIGESELDAMAAKLNAEFEEAEVFELVVE